MVESCCTDGLEVIFGYPLRMKDINVFSSILGEEMITDRLPMVLKDRQCRLLIYELTKSKFIHDIIVIRALKYTRSDPGLWSKSVRFQVLLRICEVPLGQTIHLCVTLMSVQDRARNGRHIQIDSSYRVCSVIEWCWRR